MQRLLVMLSLVITTITFQAEAATLDWLRIPAKGSVVGSSSNELVGDYANKVGKTIDNSWLFSISDLSKVQIDINEFSDQFLALTVTLDNVLLNFSNGDWSFLGALKPGKHKLNIKGVSSKKGQNIGIDIAAIPVPATIWLFGSALLGLMGVSRLKPRLNLNH